MPFLHKGQKHQSSIFHGLLFILLLIKQYHITHTIKEKLGFWNKNMILNALCDMTYLHDYNNMEQHMYAQK